MDSLPIPQSIRFSDGQLATFERSDSEIEQLNTKDVLEKITARYVGLGQTREALELGKSQSVEDLMLFEIHPVEQGLLASAFDSLKEAFSRLQYSILAALPASIYDASQQLSHAIERSDIREASRWIRAGVDTRDLLLDALEDGRTAQILTLMKARSLAGEYFNPVLDADGNTLSHYISHRTVVNTPKELVELTTTLGRLGSPSLEKAVQRDNPSEIKGLLQNVETLDRAYIKRIAGNIARGDFNLAHVSSILDALESIGSYPNPLVDKTSTLLSLALAAGDQGKPIANLLVEKLLKLDSENPSTLADAVKNQDSAGLQTIIAARLQSDVDINLNDLTGLAGLSLIGEPVISAVCQTLQNHPHVSEDNITTLIRGLLNTKNPELKELALAACVEQDQGSEILYQLAQRSGPAEMLHGLRAARLQDGRSLNLNTISTEAQLEEATLAAADLIRHMLHSDPTAVNATLFSNLVREIDKAQEKIAEENKRTNASQSKRTTVKVFGKLVQAVINEGRPGNAPRVLALMREFNVPINTVLGAQEPSPLTLAVQAGNLDAVQAIVSTLNRSGEPINFRIEGSHQSGPLGLAYNIAHNIQSASSNDRGIATAIAKGVLAASKQHKSSADTTMANEIVRRLAETNS